MHGRARQTLLAARTIGLLAALAPLGAMAQAPGGAPDAPPGTVSPPAPQAQGLEYTLREGAVLVGVPISEDANTVTIQTPSGPTTVYKMNIAFIRPARTGPVPPFAPPSPRPPSPYSIHAAYEQPPDPRIVARGIELEAGIGTGSFFDNSGCAFANNCNRATARPVWFSAGVGLDLRAGYRPVPTVSAGAHLHYQALSVNDQVIDSGGLGPFVLRESLSAFTFGLYARVYPTRVQAEQGLEVSFGLGIDFFSRLSGNMTSDNPLVEIVRAPYHLQAASFPVDAAIDYYLARGLAIGGSLAASLWIPTSACSTTRGVETCASSNLRPNGSWFVGLGLRYSYFH